MFNFKYAISLYRYLREIMYGRDAIHTPRHTLIARTIIPAVAVLSLWFNYYLSNKSIDLAHKIYVANKKIELITNTEEANIIELENIKAKQSALLAELEYYRSSSGIEYDKNKPATVIIKKPVKKKPVRVDDKAIESLGNALGE